MGSVLDRIEGELHANPEAALRELDAIDVPEPEDVRALWVRGQALMPLRRLEEALTCFEEVLSRARRRGDDVYAPLAEYAISGVFFAQNRYPEALTHARAALDAALSGPENPPLHGKILVGLGHAHYVQGQYDAALGHYHRALNIFQSLRDLHTLGALYSGLAAVHADKGELQPALKYAQLRVATFEALHNPRSTAEGLAVLASICLRFGEAEQAIATAADALGRAQRLESVYVECLARAVLADAYLRTGRPEAAQHEARTVVELTSSDADPVRTDALVVLAEIAEREGCRQEADGLFERVLAALPESGNAGRLAEVALEYSRLLERRGDTERALEFARVAAEARTA